MTEAYDGKNAHASAASANVGSLADEADKLFRVLRGRMKEPHDDGLDGVGELLHDLDHHLGSGDACCYCPLCRLIGVAKQPEVRQHLASAAGSLAAALASALATPAPKQSRDERHPGDADGGLD